MYTLTPPFNDALDVVDSANEDTDDLLVWIPSKAPSKSVTGELQADLLFENLEAEKS